MKALLFKRKRKRKRTIQEAYEAESELPVENKEIKKKELRDAVIPIGRKKPKISINMILSIYFDDIPYSIYYYKSSLKSLFQKKRGIVWIIKKTFRPLKNLVQNQSKAQ